MDPVKEAMAAVARAVEFPADQRGEYLEMLGHAATKYMRATGGDDYVRGWLEAALAELDKPPMFVLLRRQ